MGREEKQKAQLENIGMNWKKRIAEMSAFLQEQPTTIADYHERLIAKVTVYEDKFAVEFKSGVTVDTYE